MSRPITKEDEDLAHDIYKAADALNALLFKAHQYNKLHIPLVIHNHHGYDVVSSPVYRKVSPA